jgi:hypothetical protein
MQKFNYLLLVSLLYLTACNPKVGSQPDASPSAGVSVTPQISAQEHPDKIVASKSIQGRLVKFLQGDYFYATIETEQGESLDFSIDGSEDCFLAQNKSDRLSIQYDDVERYIPETGGYQPIRIIRGLQTEKTDWVAWRLTVTPETMAQCRRDLVEKATR